jgi:hypothetical protein
MCFIVCLWYACFSLAEDSTGGSLGKRTFFEAGFPRLVWFRNLEIEAFKNKPLESPESYFNIYNATVAKAFDEEKYGLSRFALPYYRLLKQRNPEFLMILHYNGASRDPRDGSEIFPGHWLHRAGCRIESDVPAEQGISEIRVGNPGLFSMEVGKKMKLPDNMTICALHEDGTPNWLTTEYVQLAGIDMANKTIRIRRGFLNSIPKEWKSGEAYIAPVGSHGRWTIPGDKNEPLNTWRYNFSLDAPRDAQGRTLADVLADDLAAKLGPGGPGDFFDGVTFDVMPFLLSDRDADPDDRNEGFKNLFGYYDHWDTDGDGKPDMARKDGVDRFASGVSQFQHRLREKLGPDKLIMMDSGRRANHVLNGVEAEGWPIYTDLELNEWSGGINEHRFWAERGVKPQMRYIHRYGMPPDLGQGGKISRDYPRARLIMAAAQLLGNALVTQHNPPAEPGELFGCFDELKKGNERVFNWLGRPLEEPRQLVRDSKDMLNGAGVKMTEDFIARFSAGDTEIITENQELTLRPKTSSVRSLAVQLKDIPVSDSGDVLISLRVKADPMRGMEDDVARIFTLRSLEKNQDPAAVRTAWTWADGNWFNATFYFRKVKGGSLSLSIEAEDSGAVYLSDIKAFGGADVMCRRFENGLVLANPGLTPFEFDLKSLYPDCHFRRLQGSHQQDPIVNSGLPAGDTVTIRPRDALFLITQ